MLDEIERTYPDGNILVVSHKATTRIMLCFLLGIDVGRYRDRLSLTVAALSIVEMTKQGPLLKVLGTARICGKTCACGQAHKSLFSVAWQSLSLSRTGGAPWRIQGRDGKDMSMTTSIPQLTKPAA